MQNLIAIARLYFIHIFAFLAVGISMYYPPWDIILSLLYLVVIGSEARLLREFAPSSRCLVILAWQVPGMVLFFLVISHTTLWDLSNYAFFIMLFWYTALAPILSLLPGIFWRGWPLYYYFLLALPFIMTAYHFIFSSSVCSLKQTIR
jgi:hypothetical protein